MLVAESVARRRWGRPTTAFDDPRRCGWWLWWLPSLPSLADGLTTISAVKCRNLREDNMATRN